MYILPYSANSLETYLLARIPFLKKTHPQQVGSLTNQNIDQHLHKPN